MPGADALAPELVGTVADGTLITVAASNVTIRGFRLNAQVSGGSLNDSDQGIAGSGNSVTIRDNTFRGFDLHGVAMSSSNNLDVEYNRLGDIGSDPIQVVGGTGVIVDHNLIEMAPTVTSANAATFTVGSAGTFTVTTSGAPTAATITESGALPSGVTFTNNGDGTATLAGTPGAGTAGTYPLTITASNGVLPDATQAFTLTVNQPPTTTTSTTTSTTTTTTSSTTSTSTTTTSTTTTAAPTTTTSSTTSTSTTSTSTTTTSTTTTSTTLPEDTGSIPPDAATAKCEDGVAKALSNYMAAVIKCHIKSADAGVKGRPLDDEPCESNPTTGKGAKEKFDAAITKLATTCSGCAVTNAPALRVAAESFLEQHNRDVYCAGTTPFAGSDDTGTVPPDAATKKCEDGVAKALGKYIGAVIKCHIKSADSGAKGSPLDDEPCESNPATGKGARDKYDAAIAKLATTCGGCAITNAGALRDAAESFVDANNGQVYCAP